MVEINRYRPVQPRITRYGAKNLILPGNGWFACQSASESVRTIRTRRYNTKLKTLVETTNPAFYLMEVKKVKINAK